MRFTTENEVMEWKVLNYQYPDAEPSKPKEYSYEANWLTIQVAHEMPEEGLHVFRESFLMTFELQEIIDALKKIREEESYYYKGEFIEPVLEVEAMRHKGKTQVSFDLVFDNYEIMVADNKDDQELEAFIGELEDILKEFPER